MNNEIITPIIVAKENVSDDIYIITSILKKNGDLVKKGEMIGSYETSKALFDVESPKDGYIFFGGEEGDNLKVGHYFAVISDMPEIQEGVFKQQSKENEKRGLNDSDEIRFSKKARELIEEYNVEMNLFKGKKIVTKEDVISIIKEKETPSSLEFFTTNFLKSKDRIEKILIIGAGTAATLVADIIFKIPTFECVGIIDDKDELQGREVWGIPIVGKINDVPDLIKNGLGTCVINTITSRPNRKKIYDKLKSQGIHFINIIDPSVCISNKIEIGDGNIIMGHSRIGPFVSIGNNNLISAYVNIEHHNILQDHCTFGPGVMTSGSVHMGNSILFGTGIFVEPSLRIGDNSIISSGVTLTRNVPMNSIVKTKDNIVIKTKD